MTKERKYPCPPTRAAAIDDAIQKFSGKDYKAMQAYVHEKYGFRAMPSWIGDRKEHLGYAVRPGPRR
jgi:hypothetical protein